MENTKIVIVDCATGEVIEREMNSDELAQRELDSQIIAPVLDGAK